MHFSWQEQSFRMMLLVVSSLSVNPPDSWPAQAGPGASLPKNLIVDDTMRPFVVTMWERSPTFRQQCARLAQHEEVTLVIEWVVGLEAARARSRMDRDGERLVVRTRIRLRRPELYAELVAHELEHVIEQIDGLDLPRLAGQRLDGVVDLGGIYETARADSIGRLVAREVLFP